MTPGSDPPVALGGSAAVPGFGAYDNDPRLPNTPEMPHSVANSAFSAARPASGYSRAQADLVAALTGTGPIPPGFDAVRVDAARQALLRKRAGEVAKQWPLLRASMRDGFEPEFASWAKNRPTVGSFRDGWDFAAELADRSALPGRALAELTERQLVWRYDGTGAPARRRLPRLAVLGGRVMIQIGGRVRMPGRRPVR